MRQQSQFQISHFAICVVLVLLVQSTLSFLGPVAKTTRFLPNSNNQDTGRATGSTFRGRQVTGIFQTTKDPSDIENTSNTNSTVLTEPLCRIVTRTDAKLPTTCSKLPSALCEPPHLLDKLDAYYHAKAHQQTQTLQYLDRSRKKVPTMNDDRDDTWETDRKEEKKLVSVARDSLEDAGFELLSRRDIDLCESLNAGYLLRLSILPDVKECDPGIAREFFPERFYKNGTAIDKDELLFDGRVLVFWRGYSQEVTKGRMLLPKVDYLQASLVQRFAAKLKSILDTIESGIVKATNQQSRKLKSKAKKQGRKLKSKVKQSVREGWQQEQADNWLLNPDPWEVARPNEAVEVHMNCGFEIHGGGFITGSIEILDQPREETRKLSKSSCISIPVWRM